MIPKNIEQRFNEQINAELYSAYLYFAMEAWFVAENYPGFGGWMRAQAIEEMSHAMKFYDFINDRGGRVELQAIGKPEADFASPVGIFEKVLAHERHVTSLIHGLVKLADDEGDYPSRVFLQWFVTEQVEEEATADRKSVV